ncbi:MAG: hypothetical protein R3F14_03910 [Polyangiaceae bacterium]
MFGWRVTRESKTSITVDLMPTELADFWTRLEVNLDKKGKVESYYYRQSRTIRRGKTCSSSSRSGSGPGKPGKNDVTVLRAKSPKIEAPLRRRPEGVGHRHDADSEGRSCEGPRVRGARGGR